MRRLRGRVRTNDWDVADYAIPWTPNEISGSLDYWIDASDTGQITASGNNFTSYQDKFATGSWAVSGTGSPQTGTRTQNGLNVIDFDGNQSVRLASEFTPVGFFLAGLFIVDSASAQNGLMSGSLSRIRVLFRPGTDFNLVLNLNGTGSSDFGSGPFSYGPLLVIVYTDDQSTGVVYARVNGTLQAQTATLSAAISNGDVGLISSRDTFAVGFNGALCEGVAAADELASSDMEKLEGYLAHKWGATSLLPGGHPYKSSAPTT